MTEKITDSAGRVFVSPRLFEEAYGRPGQTVRLWIALEQVRTLKRNGRVYVHLIDALARHEITASQKRRTKRGA